MENARQSFDCLAWDENDEASETSLKNLRRTSTCDIIRSFAEQTFGQRAVLVSPLIIGGYNILYRTQLEGVSNDVLVRIPCPNLAQFPTEKFLREAATANYISQHTQVPVPHVFDYGLSADFGPFLVLQHIKNHRDLSDALTVPNEHPDKIHVLNHNISEVNLKALYSQVASYVLQLSLPSFSLIGSLVEDDSKSCTVAARPITQNMNNMVQLANIPRAVLPLENETYRTSDEWYVALADMHIAQLVFQHNDLVTTEDDCRNKYVSRQLFRSLAKQGRLSSYGFAEDKWSAYSRAQTRRLSQAPAVSGSFRLWCDDFRPANILLHENDDIVSIIDWEFAYAAPTQFILDPPWWLLLDVPEMWSSGIEDWARIYEVRLQTWLSAMEQAEKVAESEATFIPFKLSVHMRQSWENGRFWLNYAARKSWAFDTIFWKYLDEKFFGDRAVHVPQQEYWKTRIELLGERERAAMDTFVERKMNESKERVLVHWNPEDVIDRMAQVVFD